MRLIDTITDTIADRIHRRYDDLARAQGLAVEHLPGGRRRISDPRLPDLLDQRRLRAMRGGLDSIDRALLDAATADLYAATARRAGIPVPDRIARRCRHLPTADQPATTRAHP